MYTFRVAAIVVCALAFSLPHALTSPSFDGIRAGFLPLAVGATVVLAHQLIFASRWRGLLLSAVRCDGTARNEDQAR